MKFKNEFIYNRLFHLRYPKFWWHKIKKYKNIHVGKRCFLIMTGPSLTISDLELLKNEYTFSVNSIINCFDKTDFRPNYYCIWDSNAYKLLKDKINASDFDMVFLHAHGDMKGFKGRHTYVRCNAFDPFDAGKTGKINPIFDYNYDKEFRFGSSVVFFCLQLAYYMGFTKVYILGCDCSYGKNSSDYNKQISGAYEIKYKEINKENEIMNETFKGYLNYFKNKNFKIYNATRGGYLELLPRVNLDEVLKIK